MIQDASPGNQEGLGVKRTQTAYTLTGARGREGKQAVVFDEVQITHPENRSNPRPGDPAPTLSKRPRPVVFNPGWYTAHGNQGATPREELCPPLVGAGGGHGDRAPVVTFADVVAPLSSGSGGGAGHPQSQPGAETTVALAWNQERDLAPHGGPPRDTAPAMSSSEAKGQTVVFQPGGEMRIRRLTPREWERLQGLPDDWTAVGGLADSPRYRMLGDAVTAPVGRWLGSRIRRADAGDL